MSLQTQHDPKNEAEITYWNALAAVIGSNANNLRTSSGRVWGSWSALNAISEQIGVLLPQAFDPYRQPVARLRDRPHLPARYVAMNQAHSCRR